MIIDKGHENSTDLVNKIINLNILVHLDNLEITDN